jgi:hypothetical protein
MMGMNRYACDKWLKDHTGCTLPHYDRAHHQKIVITLSETIRAPARPCGCGFAALFLKCRHEASH